MVLEQPLVYNLTFFTKTIVFWMPKCPIHYKIDPLCQVGIQTILGPMSSRYCSSSPFALLLPWLWVVFYYYFFLFFHALSSQLEPGGELTTVVLSSFSAQLSSLALHSENSCCLDFSGLIFSASWLIVLETLQLVSWNNCRATLLFFFSWVSSCAT